MQRTHAMSLGLVLVVAALVTLSSGTARAAGSPGATATFTQFVLSQPQGGSEPAISIGPDGTVLLSALSWQLFQTNIWKGEFGTAPAFQGAPDAQIGKGIGGEDADIGLGTSGTLHITTLMFFPGPNFQGRQLGVSTITCPNDDTSDNFAHCTAQILDHTQADRPWVTSDGTTVYISYHDSGSSTGIKVWRSTDDGFTWTKVGNPIVSQGGATAMSTFNNIQGKIEADPTTHSVFAIYAAGQGGLQKATSGNFNNIIVSRSSDMGVSWTPALVFHAPIFTPLDTIFPALAVDPSNGNLYATWSDAHNVSVSASTDHGTTWSPAVRVNKGSAVTAVLPAVAARNDILDVAYYGTAASSKNDPAAIWNTFMSTSTDGGVTWTQSVVSAHANHVGVICANGIGCVNPFVTRTLLDLFELAINTQGKAAVIFTDDTLSTFIVNGTTYPLPQAIVAYQQ